MKRTWNEAFRDKRFARFFILSSFGLALIALFIQSYFRIFILDKPGTQLNDPLLLLIPPVDNSLTIFILIYATVIITAIAHYRDPDVLLESAATYTIVTLIRLLTIYAFTLEAPTGIVDLKDPLLSTLVYPSEFTKDLFFSGHMSTMMVMVLVEPVRWMKGLKIVATFLLGILLLQQHIHYTVDVVFAPLITWGVYLLVKWIKMPRTN